RAYTSPVCQDTFKTPRDAASFLACSIIAWVASSPVAWETCLANSSTTVPGPQATSRATSCGSGLAASARAASAVAACNDGAEVNSSACRVNWSTIIDRCDGSPFEEFSTVVLLSLTVRKRDFQNDASSIGFERPVKFARRTASVMSALKP